MFFSALRYFSRKMLRNVLQTFLSLYSVGPKKSANVPPNFPQNLPAKNLKKNSPTSFCRRAGRNIFNCFGNSPDPPTLAFLVFRFSLFFLCLFPSFSKDFRGSAKRKTLALFRATLCSRKKKGKGSGSFLGIFQKVFSEKVSAITRMRQRQKCSEMGLVL